jgi:hypothetical protein
VAGLWVFDPNIVPSGILKAFATVFPVSGAGDVRWEVIVGSSDNKGELLGVNFKGY